MYRIKVHCRCGAENITEIPMEKLDSGKRGVATYCGQCLRLFYIERKGTDISVHPFPDSDVLLQAISVE